LLEHVQCYRTRKVHHKTESIKLILNLMQNKPNYGFDISFERFQLDLCRSKFIQKANVMANVFNIHRHRHRLHIQRRTQTVRNLIALTDKYSMVSDI
jgi:ABC-type uncharacterized transport system involved in gliding motility auxiliary subunit